MTNLQQLRDLADPDTPLTATRQAEIKESVLESIRNETSDRPDGTSARRWSRRASIGFAVGALVVGAGTAAATVFVLDQPDPAQVDQVNAQIGSESPAGEAHFDGWRPELMSESVECRYGGDALVASASDFPLENRMAAENLVEACASAAAETGRTQRADELLCVRDGLAPQPVVLADGSTCEDNPDLRAARTEDLDALNQQRAIDVALLAVPSETGCPTLQEALDWTTNLIAERDLDLEVRVMETPGCFRATTEWSQGVTTVWPAGSAAESDSVPPDGGS